MVKEGLSLSLVYTTFSSQQEAEKIGTELVAEKLAACINIFPAMTSIYEWNGKLEKTAEVAALFKTRKGLEDPLMKEIKKRHSYDVPALFVISSECCEQEYFEWILAQTR